MESDTLFNKWNKLKKRIHSSSEKNELFPQPKGVWVCTLGKNIGFEQNGSETNFTRPVLVVKKFNNQMFWVVPLSSKQKSITFYYNFIDKYNLKASAILSQLRLVSIKRFKRYLYDFSEIDFNNVKVMLKEYLQ